MEEGMANIHLPGILERVLGSGVWWIRYTDSLGRRHLEKAGRRGDAIDLLAKRKHEILLLRKLPEKLHSKAVTFGELVQDALSHSKEANSARSTHELMLKWAIIGNDFNGRPANGITKQEIQDWLQTQTEARGWSPATRNRYQAAFSLVFTVALDNGKLTVNPASRIKRKAENNDRIRFLGADEENRLAAVLTEKWPHYLPAFLISIHTGMRASEQFGLKWDQVSLTRRTVSLYTTKGKKTRHIPLNSVALKAFQRLKKGPRASGPVHLNTDGAPLRGSRDWFEPAVNLAQIENYTWHCNRHTFASRLVMAGVDIRTVAALMGHATIQMTMRYAHLSPEREQLAVDRLVSWKELVTKSATSGLRRKKSGA
jgi:integrase